MPMRKVARKSQKSLRARSRGSRSPAGPQPSEPKDEAANLMQFIHEPIRDLISAVRQVCIDSKPRPDRALAIAELAEDLCDICAWYDSAWCAIAQWWLRVGDEASFDRVFGHTTAAVCVENKQLSHKGSTYRFLCASTQVAICAPLKVMSESSSPLSQTHRASITLRDGLHGWAASCERALAAFAPLAARWLRKQARDGALSHTVLLKLAEYAGSFETSYAVARKATIVEFTQRNTDAQEQAKSDPTHSSADLNVDIIKRSTLLIKLLSPGLACLRRWAGSQRASRLLSQGTSQLLNRLACLCANHRSYFVEKIKLNAGIAQQTPEDGADYENCDFDNSPGEMIVELTLYSRKINITLSTIAMLGDPILLKRALTEQLIEATELLRVAGKSESYSRLPRISQLVTEVAANENENESLIVILRQFQHAYETLGQSHVEHAKSVTTVQSDCNAEPSASETRADALLSVLRSMSPNDTKLEAITTALKPSVVAVMDCSEAPSQVNDALHDLQKLANILNIGDAVEAISSCSSLTPVDIAHIVALLGHISVSKEGAALYFAEALKSADSMRFNETDLQLTQCSHVDRVRMRLSTLERPLPAGIDIHLVETAFMPIWLDKLSTSTEADIATLLSDSLARLRATIADVFDFCQPVEDETSKWLIEKVSHLILLDRWVESSTSLAQVRQKKPVEVLAFLAPKLLPFANHLFCRKAVLWLPAVVEQFAFDILEQAVEFIPRYGYWCADEMASALLDFECSVSNDISVRLAGNFSGCDHVAAWAERHSRSWYCRSLLESTTRAGPSLEEACSAVKISLQAAAAMWWTRRECALRQGNLSAASARAYERGASLFQDKVVILRVQRYIQRKREAREQDSNAMIITTNALNRDFFREIDGLIREKPDDEAKGMVEKLRQAAQHVSDSEAIKLFREAAQLALEGDSEGHRLLQSAASWLDSNNRMRDVLQDALDMIASGLSEDAVQRLQNAADAIEQNMSFRAIHASTNAVAVSAHSEGPSLADRNSVEMHTDKLGADLINSAAAKQHSQQSIERGADATAGVPGSGMRAPGVETAPDFMTNGNSADSKKMPQGDAKNEPPSTLMIALEGILGRKSRKHQELAEVDITEPGFDHKPTFEKFDEHSKMNFESAADSEDEARLYDRLIAMCVAEETALALKQIQASTASKFVQLRIDALVKHSCDVGLPRPAANELTALGLRFGYSQDSLCTIERKMENANTTMLLKENNDQMPRVFAMQHFDVLSNRSTDAEVVNVNACDKNFDRWPLNSKLTINIQGLIESISETIAAVRLAGFDLVRMMTPRIPEHPDTSRPWRPPGPTQKHGFAIRELRNQDTTLKKVSFEGRMALARRFANVFIEQHDVDHDLALNAKEIQAALEKTSRTPFGGGHHFYELLVNHLANTTQDPQRCAPAKYQITGTQLSRLLAAFELSECAFVSSALRAGFSRISKTPGSLLRAGYGVMQDLHIADSAETGLLKIEAFERVLSSPAGGMLQMSLALKRVLCERCQIRKELVPYKNWVEWLIPNRTMLDLHVVAYTHSHSRIRLQFAIDAWLPVSEFRAIVARRLFWDAHRSGRTSQSARDHISAALYPKCLSIKVEAFEAQCAAALAASVSSATTSTDAKAAAAAAASAATTAYQRITLLGDDIASAPAFSVFAYHETLVYRPSPAMTETATCKYAPVASIHVSKSARVSVSVASKTDQDVNRTDFGRVAIVGAKYSKLATSFRRPIREAHNWEAAELAAYFLEVELPASVSDAVVELGISGSSVVFGSTDSIVDKLSENAPNTIARGRVTRQIHAIRASVLNAAWEKRNARMPFKWPLSTIAAFLLRTHLDAGDGLLIQKFHVAGIDGHELFGTGERGVIHEDTLRQVGVDDRSLRQRIRQAAIRERLEIERQFNSCNIMATKRQSKSFSKKNAQFKHRRKVLAPTSPETRRSDEHARLTSHESGPQALDLSNIQRASESLDFIDFIDRQSKPRTSGDQPEAATGQSAVGIFALDSIHVPSLESLRKVQDVGSLLIHRGFLDTSWIKNFADSPVKKLAHVQHPMLTARAVFTEFTYQLEQEARRSAYVNADVFW